jgi:hypothetical protein
MDVFDHFIAGVKNNAGKLAAQLGAAVHPPDVHPLSASAALVSIPSRLTDALANAGARVAGGMFVSPSANAVAADRDAIKQTLDAGNPDGLVALSSDASGNIQWHIPRAAPAGGPKLDLWLRSNLEGVRKVVLFRFPDVDALTQGAVRAAEIGLKAQTGLKKLPLAAVAHDPAVVAAALSN